MNEDKIREILREKRVSGRITCREAIKTAEEVGVSPAVIGKLLDEMKIKIAVCQLSCFE